MTAYLKLHHHSPGRNLKETFEYLILSFVLAFMLKTFILEAFIIPTGSMANTLNGAHFHISCHACAHQFNYNYKSELTPLPTTPIPVIATRLNALLPPRCPLCGTKVDKDAVLPVFAGDRVFVLKHLYGFIPPAIWDVIVFKNPTDPLENYIKRLIGTPGDKVTIIDGDIYIDDQIQTKPNHIQNSLWIPIYDSRHQLTDATNIHKAWLPPFNPAKNDTNWFYQGDNHYLRFTDNDLPDGQVATIGFNTDRLKLGSHCFLDYNGPKVDLLPYASDYKVEATLVPSTLQALCSFVFEKYQRAYQGEILASGKVIIRDLTSNTALLQATIRPLQIDQDNDVAFSILDHQLIITVNGETHRYSGANDAENWGYDPSQPRRFHSAFNISGANGDFTLKGVKLFRDTHYTYNLEGTNHKALGSPMNPLLSRLKKDEYYVLGDNSPASNDSRFWNAPGYGNGKETFRTGIVPKDYLIGRAFMVFWPSKTVKYDDFRDNLPNLMDIRILH